MPKPLADMTPEEREQCQGMWCYIFERLDEPPVGEGIIAGFREADDGRTLVVVDHPHPDAGGWGHEIDEVSPRFDLPRAWTPDGKPVEGECPVMTDNVFVTMNAAWQRGKVQQSDLDVFANHGAGIPGVLYRMAGNGQLTMGWLFRHWEKVAINQMGVWPEP